MICHNLIYKSSSQFVAFITEYLLSDAFFSAWALVHFVLSPLQLYVSSWLHHSALDPEITSIAIDVYSQAAILPNL